MFSNPGKLWTVSCGLMVSLLMGSAWASGLQGIQLNTTPLETKVTLNAESQISYQVISQNRDKIVIDLNSVDPTQSIPTDFMDADNIDQVILKPIGTHKLQMIIRGEKLGPPAIISNNATAIQKPNSTLVFSNESKTPTTSPAHIKVPGDKDNTLPVGATTQKTTASANPIQVAQAKNATDNTTPTSKNNTSVNPPSSTTSNTNNSSQSSTPTQNNTNASAQTTAIVNPDAGTNQTTQTATVSAPIPPEEDRKAFVDLNTSGSSTTVVANNNSDTGNPFMDNLSAGLGVVNSLFQHVNKSLMFSIFGITGLLLMLGFYIRMRLSGEEENFFENQQTASPGFLTNLFQSKKTRRSARRRSKGVFTTPTLSNPKNRANHPSERPVGLSGLYEQPLANDNVSREIPPRKTLNQNQALRQYTQNAAPPLYEPTKRDRTELDMELKRSLQMREALYQSNQPRKPVSPSVKPNATAMSQRPASSGVKQPQKKQEVGLPNNNDEVLEFLRSVADLMEKNGKPDLAQGVKRGMSQKMQ